MPPWTELVELVPEVAIVLSFLWYLTKRDKAAAVVQAEGHLVLRELTVAIKTMNGKS